MSRLETLYRIDNILTNCSTCKRRAELNRIHKSNFSKIDGFCNKQCEMGGKLQELGKNL